MALLAVNAGNLPGPQDLTRALSATLPGTPVVILIHGYRYSPSQADHDPHAFILSLAPQGRATPSWPRHLGLAGVNGLAVGFGWEARGTIWAAHRAAARAGRQLAALVAALHRLAPNRPVHVVAHSLGARVALAALPLAPAGCLRRIILLAAAASRAEAEQALASPAGRRAEVVNVMAPENRLFDWLLWLALPGAGLTLGAGLPGRANWLDLSLARTSGLAMLGHRIRASRARICHWSGYLRPGLFGLYRAFLLRPESLPLAVLRAMAAPAPSPRRSGFLPPLPFRRQTPF